MCTLSGPPCDSPYLWSRHIHFFRCGGTRFGRTVGLVLAPVLCFGCWGRLPLAIGRPGHGWWRGGRVLQSVRWVEWAGFTEAAAKRPPVLLALPAQPATDPQPHLVSALQQEVHQLHVWSGGRGHRQNEWSWLGVIHIDIRINHVLTVQPHCQLCSGLVSTGAYGARIISFALYKQLVLQFDWLGWCEHLDYSSFPVMGEVLGDFWHVSLTPGETSDGTGSSCPWCPCGPVVPDRAGVWSSTLSGVRTPSLLPPSTVGWHSWSAAAVPVPCSAAHPSQMTCPERRGAEQNGKNQFVMAATEQSQSQIWPGMCLSPCRPVGLSSKQPLTDTNHQPLGLFTLETH